MAAKVKYTLADEQRLMASIWTPDIRDNPYAFVMLVFPWGQAGTPLEKYTGPRAWQKRALLRVAKQIADNRNRIANGQKPQMLNLAVASGRGIGKSSLVAWLIMWMMSCNLGSTTIVAANTEAQLKSRTWPELGRWHALAINEHWFDRNSESLRPAAWFAEALKRDKGLPPGGYYYAQAQLWTEEKPDAFAGAHNPHGVFLIFDEASGIPQSIFTVSDGFFTEPALHRYWFCFSNPRRNTGPFFELFHKMRNYWECWSIDGRTVEGADSAVYDKIIAQYGEDSDEARVEVRGMFPSQGDKQFISRRLAEDARTREVAEDPGAPLHMGVDVARFGDDQSVIVLRHGRDARSIPPVRFKGLDTVQLVARVVELAEKYRPDGIFVDGAGVGGGVVDQLRSIGLRVHDVQFGARAEEDQKYQNKRVECWARMREWLQIGAIPEVRGEGETGTDLLADDLVGPQYEFDTAGRVKLEAKEKMKSRGVASPDIADALALTFAINLPRRDGGLRRARGPRLARGMDYSVLG